MLVFSKTFIKINVKIINFIKKITKKIFNIIIFPLKIILNTIRKVFLKPISFICINIRKYSTNYLKKQKIILKKVKKGVNKAKNKKLKEGF